MAPSLPPIRPEDEAVAEKLRPHGAFDEKAEEPQLDLRFDYLLRLGDDSLILGQRLTQSSDRFLVEFASKAVKEVAYHRELSAEWTIRLGDGTEESARRMADGLDWCWRFLPELFEVDETLESLIDGGVAPDPRAFEEEYRSAISGVLAEANLAVPTDQRPILGGRRGHHSEHLGHLLAIMQYLPRTYPDATW